MISYFELLKMIKEDNEPKKIRVHLTSGTSRIYLAEYDGYEFSHYYIEGDIDESYRCYLAECFLETDMFDENIEIIEENEYEPFEENKKIEKLGWAYEPDILKLNVLNKKLGTICSRIDEIIDKLNSIEQE